MSGAKKMPADQAARERIATRHDQSMLVEAGAGTGKTRLMVERIANLIGRQAGAEDRVLERLVAITFTERAAGELKQRLRGELLKRRAAAQGDDRRRYETALAKVEASAISTIHSFAAGLIRERPVEAGITPNFEVGEGAEEDVREVWVDWRDRHMELDPERWQRLLTFFKLDNQEDALGSLALGLMEHSDLLPAAPPPPEYPSAREHLDQAVRPFVKQIMAEAAKKCRDQANDKLWVNHFAELPGKIEKLAALSDEDLTEQLPLFKLPSHNRLKSPKGWSIPEDFDCAKAYLSDLQEKIDRYQTDLLAAALTDALALIVDFAQHLLREKKKRGVLAFQDLLLLARDLLAHDSEVRRYFRDKYQYVLVDEFQDTDPLQSEILQFIH